MNDDENLFVVAKYKRAFKQNCKTATNTIGNNNNNNNQKFCQSKKRLAFILRIKYEYKFAYTRILKKKFGHKKGHRDE